MSQFLIMAALFLLNTACAGRWVSKRQYGWAAVAALSAVWCTVFAALAMPR